jgi:cytochrome oxidase Cu insertion factor (SCO1/SenC/PrrC family)
MIYIVNFIGGGNLPEAGENTRIIHERLLNEWGKEDEIMKKILLGLLLLFTACCATVCAQRADSTKEETNLSPTDLDRVHVGIQAPDFTLVSSDNEEITLSSYRGKKNVVLVFYRGYW